MRYAVVLTPDDNDTLLVSVPDLPEVLTFGEDREDALLRAVDAVETALMARVEARLRRLGGLLPVWRGTSGIETHLNAASAVFQAGAHYAVMPEGGTSGPPDRFAEFRPGAAVIASSRIVPASVLSMP